MNTRPFFLMCVLACINGHAFSAEPDMVSCPQVQVGDMYEQVRRNGAESKSSFTISAVSSDTIEATTQSGVTVLWDKSFNVIKAADGRTFSPKFQQVPDCPFKLGDKKTYPPVSFPGNSAGSMITGRSPVITVDDRYGTTKIPAGEFKTIRVISVVNYTRERTGRSASGRITRTSYVTPDGIIVRMVNEDQDFSYGSTNTFSLEMISLPKNTRGTDGVDRRTNLP